LRATPGGSRNFVSSTAPVQCRCKPSQVARSLEYLQPWVIDLGHAVFVKDHVLQPEYAEDAIVSPVRDGVVGAISLCRGWKSIHPARGTGRFSVIRRGANVVWILGRTYARAARCARSRSQHQYRSLRGTVPSANIRGLHRRFTEVLLQAGRRSGPITAAGTSIAR
jgi:hypothetical protein